uniref:Uncharacterized protein n=1 Tax=Dictyoglomus thermophilum TaxID=14 RepID=A0A7C3MQ58_DICTH
MEWIVFLYILFIILSATLNAIKEVNKQKKVVVIKPIEEKLEKTPKTESPPKEKTKVLSTLYSEKPRIESKTKEIVQGKKIQEEPSYIEKSLKNNLPEIIALIEIMGPPRALQGWSPPYKRKN